MMFSMPGIAELLVIGVILFVLVGVPLLAVVVVMLVKRSKSPTYDETPPDKSNHQT